MGKWGGWGVRCLETSGLGKRLGPLSTRKHPAQTNDLWEDETLAASYSEVENKQTLWNPNSHSSEEVWPRVDCATVEGLHGWRETWGGMQVQDWPKESAEEISPSPGLETWVPQDSILFLGTWHWARYITCCLGNAMTTSSVSWDSASSGPGTLTWKPPAWTFPGCTACNFSDTYSWWLRVISSLLDPRGGPLLPPYTTLRLWVTTQVSLSLITVLWRSPPSFLCIIFLYLLKRNIYNLRSFRLCAIVYFVSSVWSTKISWEVGSTETLSAMPTAQPAASSLLFAKSGFSVDKLAKGLGF